jgi:hypothetical protein
LFDIFIDDLVAGLHDTCSEHGICMGQTDVASCYMRMMQISFTPMACKVDGLHPHLAQQMADAGNFTKSKVMVFHLRSESCSVPARTWNAWTLGGIAIDQVSKYKYLGVVYQEDGSWQAHAQRRLQMQEQPMGTGGHCCHAAVCRQRSDCSWFRPSSIPRSCMARKCGNDEGGQRQDVSGRKALRSILACIPRLLF